MADGDSKDDSLPPNWIRKESKSKPGRFYYANRVTGKSVWRRDLVTAESIHTCSHQSDITKKEKPTQNKPDIPSNSNKWKPITQSCTPTISNLVATKGSKPCVDRKLTTKSSSAKSKLVTHEITGKEKCCQAEETKLASSVKGGSILKTEKVKKARSVISAQKPFGKRRSPELIKHAVGRHTRHDLSEYKIPKMQSNNSISQEPPQNSNSENCRNLPKIKESGISNTLNADTQLRRAPTVGKERVNVTETGGSIKSKYGKDAKKLEEQEDKFEQLIEKSVVNSAYIDLQSPIGSKHVKDVGHLDKFTGPISASKLKSKRFTPFPNSGQNVKQAAQDDRAKRSRSDTTLLTKKPDTKYQRRSAENTKSESISKDHDGTKATTVISQIDEPHSKRDCVPSSTGTDVCRAISLSIDDDWEMLSEDGEDGTEDNVVSFDLNSDVVMASISQEDSAVPGQRSLNSGVTDCMSLDDEHRVMVVIDTCSMGNFPSILEVNYLLFPDSNGDMVEYCVHRIVIPWQVLQELDILKDNKSGSFSAAKQNRAKRVAKLIHGELRRKQPRVKLQSPVDDAADVNGFRIQTADDHIIKCCLSLQMKLGTNHKVVLITEDVNLINKCIACDLEASEFLNLRVRYNTYAKKTASDGAKSPILSTPARPMPLVGAQTTPNLPKAVIKPFSPARSCPTVSQLPSSPAAPALSPSVSGDSPSFTQMSKLSSLSKKSQAELKDILSKLEDLILPVLCKCLAIELCDVFGDIWLSMVYRKPPWKTLLPVLESLNKHWIAVFGLVLSRHTVKSVQTLLDVYLLHTPSTEGVMEAIIAAVSLIRAVDSARRSYSAEARALLPQLNVLLTSLKDEDVPDATLSDADSGGCRGEHSGGSSSGEGVDVASELTKVFTRLAAECDVVEGEAARQGVDIVMKLGSVYQAALAIPLEISNVGEFLNQLNSVAQLLSVEVSISLDGLSEFIKANRPLMLEGLSQLERLALTLYGRL